jgi:hypothetical protein
MGAGSTVGDPGTTAANERGDEARRESAVNEHTEQSP